MAVIDEAQRHGLPVVGHVPLAVDAAEASDLGVRSFEHFRNIEVACSSDAEALRAHRTKLLDEGPGRVGYELRTEIHWLQRPVALATYDAARCTALLERLARNGTFQTPTLFEPFIPVPVGQEAVVADADKAAGERVHQEAADELTA